MKHLRSLKTNYAQPSQRSQKDLLEATQKVFTYLKHQKPRYLRIKKS